MRPGRREEPVARRADRFVQLVARLSDAKASPSLPHVQADRALYQALQAGEYKTWRERPLSAIEDSGQQEVLNWMRLAGAMNVLGRRPTETSYVQSDIFNSNKCFAVFEP